MPIIHFRSLIRADRLLLTADCLLHSSLVDYRRFDANAHQAVARLATYFSPTQIMPVGSGGLGLEMDMHIIPTLPTQARKSHVARSLCPATAAFLNPAYVRTTADNAMSIVRT